MNVQIPPELLLLVKMHDEMDGRNGLLKNGSQSGLCENTEVWSTSIIDSQFNCISLPCLLLNATHVNDIFKTLQYPQFSYNNYLPHPRTYPHERAGRVIVRV